MMDAAACAVVAGEAVVGKKVNSDKAAIYLCQLCMAALQMEYHDM